MGSVLNQCNRLMEFNMIVHMKVQVYVAIVVDPISLEDSDSLVWYL